MIKRSTCRLCRRNTLINNPSARRYWKPWAVNAPSVGSRGRSRLLRQVRSVTQALVSCWDRYCSGQQVCSLDPPADVFQLCRNTIIYWFCCVWSLILFEEELQPISSGVLK